MLVGRTHAQAQPSMPRAHIGQTAADCFADASSISFKNSKQTWPVSEFWNVTALVRLLSSLKHGREMLTEFAQPEKIQAPPGTNESTVEKGEGIVILISSIVTAVQRVQKVRYFMLDLNMLCSSEKFLDHVGGVEASAVTMPSEPCSGGLGPRRRWELAPLRSSGACEQSLTERLGERSLRRARFFMKVTTGSLCFPHLLLLGSGGARELLASRA